MRKVTDQMRMKLNGGHNVVGYPDAKDRDEKHASEPGVAGWERKCPKTGHTLVHMYDGIVYDPKRGGDGRRYVCLWKNCT